MQPPQKTRSIKMYLVCCGLSVIVSEDKHRLSISYIFVGCIKLVYQRRLIKCVVDKLLRFMIHVFIY